MTVTAVLLTAGVTNGAVVSAITKALKSKVKLWEDIGASLGSELPKMLGQIVNILFKGSRQVVSYLGTWLLILAMGACLFQKYIKKRGNVRQSRSPLRALRPLFITDILLKWNRWVCFAQTCLGWGLCFFVPCLWPQHKLCWRDGCLAGWFLMGHLPSFWARRFTSLFTPSFIPVTATFSLLF